MTDWLDSLTTPGPAEIEAVVRAIAHVNNHQEIWLVDSVCATAALTASPLRAALIDVVRAATPIRFFLEGSYKCAFCGKNGMGHDSEDCPSLVFQSALAALKGLVEGGGVNVM